VEEVIMVRSYVALGGKVKWRAVELFDIYTHLCIFPAISFLSLWVWLVGWVALSLAPGRIQARVSQYLWMQVMVIGWLMKGEPGWVVTLFGWL
jgi:uncharacterized membrane protein YGL010W